MNKKRIYLAIFILLISFIDFSMGACSIGGCGASGVDSWQQSAQAFLNSEDSIIGTMQYQIQDSKSFNAGMVNADFSNENKDNRFEKDNNELLIQNSKADEYPKGKILKSLDTSFGPSIIIDVSNKTSKGDGGLKGAINIPWTRFIRDNGTFKNESEIRSLLSAAGIHPDDNLIIYGNDFSTGEATLVFLAMTYLGHKNIEALDGGLVDWMEASLPMETEENLLKPTKYTSEINDKILAKYEYIESKEPQLVDARSFVDYGKKSIPNSILINPDELLTDSRLKTAKELNDSFARLDRNKPVIIYSENLLRTSLVWYALEIMGFDSRIYAWQDYIANEKYS